MPAAWNADSERRVETVEAEMEAIPLPDDSVDQIISNGVINLSPRKARVLAECARVLRPGGRFCVSDLTVAPDEAPPEILAHPATWAGCVSGALSEIDYIEKLKRSGFTGVQVLHREPFSVDDCALYPLFPLFPEDLIRLMKKLIAPEKQNAVAVAVVITASR